MFKIFPNLRKDLGVDLGTSSTLIYVKDKGIMVNEPSVVAINTRTDQIIAIGDDAKRMIGKTPSHIMISKPLVEGIISDFEVTEKMLKYFIEKILNEKLGLLGSKPRIVIGIPLDVTEVERKAVEDAALGAGAREVFLVEEPMAAAIGARMPIQESTGNLIVDIGGGTTQIAVISLSGVVVSKSIHIAGDVLTKNIIQYIRENFNLLIGDITAERVKIKLAAVYPAEKPVELAVSGRDLLNGLPKEITITDSEVREAIMRSIRSIVTNIKSTIEQTPPELVADIYRRGIILSGGGALLKGLDELVKKETRVPVTIIDEPLTTVVRGTGLILEDLKGLQDILIPSAR
ncbi:rod shape-determining protein [Candidatus Kuenenbacteria bacterium RIFCSPHIGHO2_02_FULL_39_13]|uniref:Cell shape-determining protein MreB n=1 Tax=Candidatus Kuenenbacteria bacterium RIFCSPHIGHO2_02_FULL_39_13 TaxID=1798561 RepID=A0A1F6FLK3_9BACT|nr:MAG: rod shape-determining protein [Candidatus Kuenenbacteria bacterium RIFCSPHIGHO2_02_FULL_39_13]